MMGGAYIWLTEETLRDLESRAGELGLHPKDLVAALIRADAIKGGPFTIHPAASSAPDLQCLLPFPLPRNSPGQSQGEFRKRG